MPTHRAQMPTSSSGRGDVKLAAVQPHGAEVGYRYTVLPLDAKMGCTAVVVLALATLVQRRCRVLGVTSTCLAVKFIPPAPNKFDGTGEPSTRPVRVLSDRACTLRM